MISDNTITGAWEMTAEYRTFVETVLDAKIALRPAEVYELAGRLMKDPALLKLHDERYQAWWDSKPFADMDVEGMENNPEAPLFEVNIHDFWLEVAHRAFHAMTALH